MKFTARIMLIDCGKASKKTGGLMTGPFTEGGQPPYIHWG
jgi:hypothetical protein